jgi:putative phosphoribosyl transferase
MKFRDRFDAGERLADKIKKYKDGNAVILAIPRGGVETGYELAEKTDLPLDVILIKKIGHPLNSEYAIGSVSLYGRIVNAETISEAYLEEETRRIRGLLRERYRQYMAGRPPVELKGKTVILTDDGLATGSTMQAAVELVRNSNPEKIVIAIPVAPRDTIEKMKRIADEVICEFVPQEFYGVGQFYENFDQVSDTEAIELLKKANQIHVRY